MKRLIIFILAASVVFCSCEKGDAIQTPIDSGDNPLELAEAALDEIIGFVLDEQGDAIVNAKVTLAGNWVFTDQNGVYSFQNIQVPGRAKIQVEAAGFFEGSRTFYPKNDDQFQLDFNLAAEDENFSFNAADGISYQSPDGVELVFSPNSISSPDGSAYQGTVVAHYNYLDAAEEKSREYMPGELLGIDNEDKISALENFGTIAIELRGNGGEELNILSGSTVRIKVPLKNEIAQQLPSEIELAYFDQTKNLWVKDGDASLENNFLVAEVSHFSYWVWMKPYSGTVVIVDGTIANTIGTPLSRRHFWVSFNNIPNNWIFAMTNLSGQFRGAVPSTAQIKLSLADQCGQTHELGPFGPYAVNTSLGTLTDPSLNQIVVNINAQIINCSGTAVTNGYLAVQNPRKIFTTNNLGIAQGALLSCNTQINAYAYDHSTQLVSPAVLLNSVNILNAGTFSCCSTNVEFMRFTFMGSNYNYVNPATISNTSHSSGQVRAYLNDRALARDATILWDGAAVGVYPIKQLYTNGYGKSSSAGPVGTVAVTYFDAVNYEIHGNFSGNILDSISGASLPISGSFKSIR